MEGDLPHIEKHIAVRLDHYIVVIGGKICADDDTDGIQDHRYSVWLYNLFLERWMKYQIPKDKQVPEKSIGACGVVIGKDIYTFGGESNIYTFNGNSESNDVWKLTQNKDASFEWKRILVEARKKKPSPRSMHSGWEYDGKLWTFGGQGEPINNYLNEHGDFSLLCNNQLLHFNPVNNEWTNLKCCGTVPSPRAHHATAAIEDKCWLYGGSNFSIHNDDLFELNMHSLIWTQIQTTVPKPSGIYGCTLSVIRNNQLVLHNGDADNFDTSPFKQMDTRYTWIIDLSSLSWKEYRCVDIYRAFNTGCPVINNCIIIIGGTLSCSHTYTPTTSIMLEPRSLQQLSMQTVYEHRGQLPWKSLPPKLIQLMQCGSNDDPTQDSPQEPDLLLDVKRV